MMDKRADRADNAIPRYTKIGIRVTAVVMVILLFMILKNCAFSLYYASTTTPEESQQAYDLGFQAGRSQSESGKKQQSTFESENLLLKKDYQKGFRDGWDSAKEERVGKEEASSETD